MGSSHHSSSRSHRPSGSRSHSRSRPTHRSRSRSGTTSSRRTCKFDPLILCGCIFGTPFIQSFLLLFVPFCIAVIYFLAGFYKIPVWKFEDTVRVRAVYAIAAQGFSVNGDNAQFTKFLYDTSWPAPMSGVPLLLLFHLILSILIVFWLLILFSIGLNAVRNRSSTTPRRDAWSRAVRKPRWYERAVTVVLTLATGTMLGIDLAVWIIAREGKHFKLNPDVLGYFVNIVVLLLWILWIVLQCAATQDRRAYYIEGGGRVYEG